MAEQQSANHFDIASGTLLIGREAFDAHLEAGGHPLDIVDLPNYLAGNVEVKPAVNIAKVENSEWDPDLDVPYAQWLHSEALQADPPGRLNREVLRLAGNIGLGASLQYFRNSPGTLSDLYQKAELEGVKTSGIFDDWSTADWVNYITTLGESLQRKPTGPDIDEASTKPGNPSIRVMNIHGISPARIIEMAGWVDVNGWSRENYIDWGVKFMLANEGQKPTARLMRILASKGFGFEPNNIYNGDIFENLIDYQGQVKSVFDKLIKEKTEAEAIREAEYQMALAQDPLLERLVAMGGIEARKIQIHARYMLSILLIPDIDDDLLRQICTPYSSSRFIGQLRSGDPSLTAQQIEDEAIKHYLHDIIWPNYGFMERMRVIDE